MAPHKLYKVLAIVLLMLIASCKDQQKEEHEGHGEQHQAIYTCPMHPEVLKKAPGSCPICGMDLVKKEEEAKAVQHVELEALLKPANAFVVSTVQVTTVAQRKENIELNVLGDVAYDTRQIGTVSSRVSGRVEKLYVKYKYQRVQKGQRVMDIYSPELATAQQNLLFLLNNDPGNTSLINAARDRLLLLGLNSQQINKVVSSKKPVHSVSVYSNYSGFATDLNNNNANADDMNTVASKAQDLSLKEGMYLQKGQAAFSVYNAKRVWILLNLFPDQQALIKVGNAVRFVAEASPEKNFRGTIDYIEPIFRQGSRTLTARVDFNNTNLRLPIGSRVRATIYASSKDALWLPKEAVVSLGRNKIVFIKEGVGFRARQITTGIELNNSIEVLKGITVTDSIAINAQYLVDNESFIQVK
jgi:membrane fusion protein, copper/silver efflux system